MDLENLETRRENMCKSFAKSAKDSEKMTNLFIKNEKNHQMNTRHQEKYMVYKANTERYKKSPIIYIQNLLNQKGNT